jgi:hypothetical protein
MQLIAIFEIKFAKMYREIEEIGSVIWFDRNSHRFW